MKITMLTCLAGADFCWNPGDTVESEDAQATRLIAAGYAVPVKSPAKANPPKPKTVKPAEVAIDPGAVAAETTSAPASGGNDLTSGTRDAK